MTNHRFQQLVLNKLDSMINLLEHNKANICKWLDSHNNINKNWFSTKSTVSDNPHPDLIIGISDGCGNYVYLTQNNDLLIKYYGKPLSDESSSGDGSQTSPKQFIELLKLFLNCCNHFGIQIKDERCDNFK